MVILYFLLCSAAASTENSTLDDCESGYVIYRTCQMAEQHIRGGMRAGQTLYLYDCEAIDSSRYLQHRQR